MMLMGGGAGPKVESVCVCVDAHVCVCATLFTKRVGFSAGFFLFHVGAKETMTRVQTGCEQVVAGGHSTYCQGMANEEPGSTVL